MTCHHAPGDPNCSSHPNHPDNPNNIRVRELESRTPDSERYEILDIARFGQHVVLKVKYPNCSKCSYEGVKVMVFFDVSEAQIIRWRKIDPHFRDNLRNVPVREAPGPAARFPASDEGWLDACEYAERKATRR
jgi:hypothetical protein